MTIICSHSVFITIIAKHYIYIFLTLFMLALRKIFNDSMTLFHTSYASSMLSL